MLHLALRGVRHNVSRYVATLLAILTGVAFFTATGFVSDRVINALEGDVDKQYGNVDVAVVADTTTQAPGGSFAEKLRIPGATATRIRAVPGISAVAGTATGPVAFLAPSGRSFGAGSTGRLWVTDKELNPIQLTKGRAPRGTDEIAIDRGLASRESLRLGGRTIVLSVSGKHPATIVGITSFGSSEAIDQGGTVSIPPAAAFDWLTAGRIEYQNLFLRGDGDPATLVAGSRRSHRRASSPRPATSSAPTSASRRARSAASSRWACRRSPCSRSSWARSSSTTRSA